MSVLTTECSVHGWSIEHLDENYSRAGAQKWMLYSPHRRKATKMMHPACLSAGESAHSHEERNLECLHFWERSATCFSAGGMAGFTFITAGRDGRHFRYLS
jgi:hypothetical protein